VPERLNPYVYLLASSLEEMGARCEVRNRFSLRWFLSSRESVDILHFHWAEHLCSTSKPVRAYKDLLQLLAGLLYAKASRCRLVYTVHNLEPHESKPHPVSLLAHQLITALADGLHVHDEYSLSRVRTRVKGRKPVFLVPHGNYIGSYPNQCSKTEAKARLGLEDNGFTYLFLGQIRPHKGIEDLVAAFRHVAQNGDRLVLAGWAPQDSYGRRIQEMSDGDPRIRFFPQFVANEDIQSFLNACDVCVLPYRNMTTSGAAVLALSFGRPIIAPRIGGFPSLVQRGGGLLYDPEGGGLPQALIEAKALDLETASAKALVLAQSLAWGPIARQHLTAYEKLARRDL
jgi:glycosyltransferase involved in cell wall biosynthesis